MCHSEMLGTAAGLGCNFEVFYFEHSDWCDEEGCSGRGKAVKSQHYLIV